MVEASETDSLLPDEFNSVPCLYLIGNGFACRASLLFASEVVGDALFRALRKLRAFLKRDLCFDTPPAGGVRGDATIALAGDATLIPQVTTMEN